MLYPDLCRIFHAEFGYTIRFWIHGLFDDCLNILYFCFIVFTFLVIFVQGKWFDHPMGWCDLQDAWCVMRDTWCVMRDAWCVMRDAWCVMRDTWYVIRDTWYVIRDTWYVMAWCVMRDAWCVMRDAWYVIRDTWYVMRDAWCVMRDAWCFTFVHLYILSFLYFYIFVLPFLLSYICYIFSFFNIFLHISYIFPFLRFCSSQFLQFFIFTCFSGVQSVTGLMRSRSEPARTHELDENPPYAHRGGRQCWECRHLRGCAWQYHLRATWPHWVIAAGVIGDTDRTLTIQCSWPVLHGARGAIAPKAQKNRKQIISERKPKNKIFKNSSNKPCIDQSDSVAEFSVKLCFWRYFKIDFRWIFDGFIIHFSVCIFSFGALGLESPREGAICFVVDTTVTVAMPPV